MELQTLYWTAADRDCAIRISRTLIREQLIACANILDGVTSIYEWQAELHEDPEVAVLSKTTADQVEAATRRIVELHPYDCPCVVAWPAASAHPAYQQWVQQQVSSEKPA